MIINKLENLKNIILRYSSAVVAFSGGVDSTFLARVSKDVLAGKVLLVTAYSSTYPLRERIEAALLAESMGLEHAIIESEETDIAEFVNNPPDRCYYCKRELFRKIRAIASARSYDAVFDGSNVDDVRLDYRPGQKALRELEIISPMVEAELTKSEIRELSRSMGLPTASKPSYACLASRFPYGEKFSREKLEKVGAAEESLRLLGFTQLRVRIHGDCARVEFIGSEIENAWNRRLEIENACKTAGFAFTAIDTRGYRMGAMNETLDTSVRL
jgi:uncharacterized protein